MAKSENDQKSGVSELLQQWRDRTVVLALSAISLAALPPLIVVLIQNWGRQKQYPFLAMFVAMYGFVLVLRFVQRLGPRVRGWGFLVLVYAVGLLSLIRGGLVGVGKDYTLVMPLLAILFRSKRAGYITICISVLTYLLTGLLLSHGILDEWVIYPEAIVDFSVWVAEGVYLALLLSVFFMLLLTFYNFLVRALEEQLQSGVELSRANRKLLFYSRNLEDQVAARTTELSDANKHLRREIIERLRAEQGLRFRATLLEQLRDPVIAVDLEQNIAYLNDAAQHFFGHGAVVPQGSPIATLSIEGLGASWAQIIEATLHQGWWQGVWNIPTDSGNMRNLDVRAYVIRDPEGSPEGMVSILTDVTARITSEALLQQHNRELALLNRLITAAASIAEPHQLLETMCRDLAHFFDLQQVLALTMDSLRDRVMVVSEYIGVGRPSLLNLELRTSASPGLRELLEARSPEFVSDLELDPRFGDLAPLLLEHGVKAVLLVPLVIRDRIISVLCLDMSHCPSLEDSDIALVTSVASAVSQTLEAAELRLAIEKTRAADKAKSQFINHVSHELRTPLTNIRAYLDLIRLGARERHDDYLAIARDETVRLQHLIEDLLYLSKLDLGQLEVDLQRVDLNQVVSDLALERERFFMAQGLELTVETEPDLRPVEADIRALRQVLIGLLTNALHFTPSGGQVVLKTARTFSDGREWVTVEVRDTGLGMSDEEQAQLFQRFQRGSAVELTNAPGAGVGLALSKELIELQHGRLTVKSRLQHGSTFTVWLLPA